MVIDIMDRCNGYLNEVHSYLKHLMCHLKETA